MTMISMNYLSKQMMRHVNVQIILPHEEMHPERSTPAPWKTLYFLHGYTENSSNLVQIINLQRMSTQYGIAIVVPDGENSFYVNKPERNSNYENMVAEELVSMTRKLLPLSDKYEDTWIGGISMGGFGALMLGMRHSDTFSKIVTLSPACQLYGTIGGIQFPDAMLTDVFGSRENYFANYDPCSLILKRHEEGGHMPELFMRCGTDDVLVYPICRGMIEKLQEAEVPINYGESAGMHNAEYWNPILPEAMRFLTGKE